MAMYPETDIHVPLTLYGYPRFTENQNKPRAVVHHIAEGFFTTLTDPNFWNSRGSSVHFAVAQDGRVAQLIDTLDAAYGNGDVQNPSWPLLTPGVNPNLYTVSIEHEGFTGKPWPDAQVRASAKLTAWIMRQHDLTVGRDTLIGHYRINAVNRPNCPGSAWPYERIVELMGLPTGDTIPADLNELWPYLKVIAAAAKRGGLTASQDASTPTDAESRAIRRLGALLRVAQLTEVEVRALANGPVKALLLELTNL